MFPPFLPASVNLLTEPSSINLAQKIERTKIAMLGNQQSIDTAYVRVGSGNPPILLLHGFDSSLLEFRRLMPLLAPVTQSWAVDLLGFGFTERRRGLSYHSETIKSHLYSFWKSLIDQPVILVGSSMGGATAIDFTLTHPEAVEKLVLINSVGYRGSFPIGSVILPPFDSWAVEFWRQRRLQSLFWGSALGLIDSTIIDVLRCAALPSEMPLWEEGMISFMKSGGYFGITNRISRIDKPTLIIWGTKDEVLGTADADKFKRAIAHSQLVWIEAGHTPQWEKPDLVAKEILRFIRQD